MILVQAAAITLLCGSTLFAAGSKAGRAKKIHPGARAKERSGCGHRVSHAGRQRRVVFTGDEPFHAASTMKVPVLIELFHQVKQRKLQLDDTLVITNQFRSIVDGSRTNLIPPTIPRPNFTIRRMRRGRLRSSRN